MAQRLASSAWARPREFAIVRARDKAEKTLGAKFNIKAFHDEVLNGGAMPLDLLQERIERWIKTQKPTTATSGQSIARARTFPSAALTI